MCDCGTSLTGKYMGRVGGMLGDSAQEGASQLFQAAKKRFKAFTGLGDYKIVSNSLVQGTLKPDSAARHGNGIIITYKEYLGEVTTHPTVVGAFNITGYSINPGNVTTFPWMGPVACQFDQYQPRGIVFSFRSTATDTTLASSIGSVIMATEYDVSDAAYGSKANMLNSAYSNEAKMSDDMVHGIECDPKELQRTLFYTLPTGSTIPNGSDARDYNMATFYVATQSGGLGVGQSVGSLYVHYEFELFKEQPYGGVVAKSLIYSQWDNYGEPSFPLTFATGRFTFWSRGGVTGGRDLGFYFAGAVMKIPRKWQGALFKLTLCYASDVEWESPQIASIMTPSTGVALYAPKTMFYPAGAGSGRAIEGGNSPLDPEPVSPNVYTDVSCAWYFKCDDIMLVDGTVTWSEMHPFPVVTTATGTQTCRMQVILMPNLYDVPF